MVKGNICEKCQKQQATTNLDIKGWKKWTVCDECCKELQTCSKCQKNPATHYLSDNQGIRQFCATCRQEEEDNHKDKKCADCQKVIKKGEQSFLTNDSQGKQINVCSDCKQKRGDKPNNKDGEICEKCKQHSSEPLIDLTNQRTKESWMVCQQCLKCQLCKKNRHNFMTNEESEKWEPGMLLCRECDEKLPGNKKNKPTDKDRKPSPGECCEKCGASCLVHQTKTSYTWKRKRYIKHKTDFTREETCWFGTNCPCAREFREANQQTCPHCKKREFPHMKRGWLLDYEIKKAFCSPLCHVTYRELKWEEAQRLSRVEMFPPELDVEVNPQQNTNWEQEGLRREVLFLRETVQELEQRLNNQNLTPEEQQQSNYLRNLQQNTLRNAESAYQSRYGSLNEDGSNKGKGMSGGVIALLIGGGIILIAGIIFLLTRNKKEKYE